MLRSVEAVRRLIAERVDALRNSVLEQPPSDWAGFQRVLGQYQALTSLQAEVINEDEESKQ